MTPARLYIAVLSLTAVSLTTPTFAQDVESEVRVAKEHLVSGRYTEAQHAARAALAIGDIETTLAADAHDVLVEALWRGGKAQNEETLALAMQALELREAESGKDHPRLAKCLDNLGILFFLRADYARARPPFERALKILEGASGSQRAALAGALTRLALLNHTTGNYTAARPLFERALSLQKIVLGPDDLEVGKTLNNFATFLKDIGDYDSAESRYTQALSIVEAALGSSHPLIAIGTGNLGELHHRRGNHRTALSLYERSIEIKEAALGPKHASLAITLSNLGELYHDLGDFKKADRLFHRALQIQEDSLGPDHPEVAYSVSNLAELLAKTGQPEAALPSYERALKNRRDNLGRSHPLVADTLSKIAFVYRETGRTQAALKAALEAETIGRDHMRATARVLPERQGLTYEAVRTSGLDLALTLCLDQENVTKERVWESVIDSRALILDEVATRHRISLMAADSRVTTLAEQYRSATERLANLLVRGPRGMSAETYRSMIRDVFVEKERAEQHLAEQSSVFRAGRSRNELGLARVREALPAASSLIAYVRYRHHKPTATNPMATEPSYLAFVLANNTAPVTAIPLGPAVEVDDAVRKWRDEMTIASKPPWRSQAEHEASALEAGIALRRKIWDPVATAFESTRQVFIVLDGSLNLVNVSALPATDKRYLVETGPLVHHLSAERDIGAYDSERSSQTSGLLVLGGVDYEKRADDEAERSTVEQILQWGERVLARKPFRGDAPSCGGFTSLNFEPLPASERESRNIEALWRAQGDRERVTRLTGRAASESAFKSLAGNYRMLHLATHGFFLGKECGPSDSWNPSGLRSSAESALLLSGLALAGANKRQSALPDDDDGVLTAEEIAALDLSGVEWVVLSACETGIGRIISGEGVLGLRRAFHIAGAKTLIMSLWPVKDDTTRRWMEALYTAHFSKGLPTAEAVGAATRSFLNEQRENNRSTHPADWGAFVATGYWR